MCSCDDPGKAGGLSGYDAIVRGLWVEIPRGAPGCCGDTERAKESLKGEKFKQADETPSTVIAKPMSLNFRLMIGPQWR